LAKPNKERKNQNQGLKKYIFVWARTRWHVERLFLCFNFLNDCFNQTRWHVVLAKSVIHLYETKQWFFQTKICVAKSKFCSHKSL